jgi:hypothetical protein
MQETPMAKLPFDDARIEALVSRNLREQPEVGEFLTECLEKMLEFGVDRKRQDA